MIKQNTTGTCRHYCRTPTPMAQHGTWTQFTSFYRGLEDAVKLQDLVGWQALLEGCLVPEWTCVQQSYYVWKASIKTGRWWITSLITKLWDVAWDQWDHRNSVLHDSETTLKESRQSAWNYKFDERRKQTHKHYQIRTGDYLQEHWNHYYPETSNRSNNNMVTPNIYSTRARQKAKTQEAWGPQQELMMNRSHQSISKHNTSQHITTHHSILYIRSFWRLEGLDPKIPARKQQQAKKKAQQLRLINYDLLVSLHIIDVRLYLRTTSVFQTCKLIL